MNSIDFRNYNPTCEALSIIYDNQKSEANVMESFITTGFLMESGYDNDIVMESVSDIFSAIIEGIKKFIENIKDFFRRILLWLTSFFKDLDKLAEDVKKVIDGKEINFTIDGYNFTVLDKSGPNMEEFQRIVSEYNDDMDNLAKLKHKDVKDKVMDWLEEDHVDKVRGEVLGTKSPIVEDEFLTEVRKYYRGGEENTVKIDVNRSYVDRIISDAKKLEDVKKSAMKDRDRLLTLLDKTESFFNRSVQTFYRDGNKTVNVNRVSVENDKFSKEDRNVTVDDTSATIASKYASYKYKQVNKIGSIINLVACERVNALKDQIKQEKVILRKCLFGDTNTKKDELSESLGASQDYDVLAMEADMKLFNMQKNLSHRILLEEADFVITSLKSNHIDKELLMEAEENKKGVFATIKKFVKDIIREMIDAFKKKFMVNREAELAWLNDIKKDIKDVQEKAKKIKSVKMYDYFAISASDQISILKNLSTVFYKLYKNGDPDVNDLSWATKIHPMMTSKEVIKDGDAQIILLNYYRTGAKDGKIQEKEFSGNDIAKNIGNMVDYMITFHGNMINEVEKLSKISDEELRKKVEELEKNGAFKESGIYLNILGSPICESDLILCENYEELFEAGQVGVDKKSQNETGTNKVENKNPSPDPNAQKIEKIAKDQAEQAKKNGENGATPKIEQNDDVKKGDNSSNGEQKEGDKETDNKKSKELEEFTSMVNSFCTHTLASCFKASDERFVNYRNILKTLEPLVIDKNGKYVSKMGRKENETNTNATVTIDK